MLSTALPEIFLPVLQVETSQTILPAREILSLYAKNDVPSAWHFRRC